MYNIYIYIYIAATRLPSRTPATRARLVLLHNAMYNNNNNNNDNNNNNNNDNNNNNNNNTNDNDNNNNVMMTIMYCNPTHCLHFSICACPPCAGAMLIFSVSFQ